MTHLTAWAYIIHCNLQGRASRCIYLNLYCVRVYATPPHPTPTLRAVLDQNLLNDDAFLYEESPDLLRFRTAAPSIELLTDWYQSRAKDIEQYSRQVFTADHREMRITSCSEAAAMGI